MRHRGAAETEFRGGGEDHLAEPKIGLGGFGYGPELREERIVSDGGFGEPEAMAGGAHGFELAGFEAIEAGSARGGHGGDQVVWSLARARDRGVVDEVEGGGVVQEIPVFVRGSTSADPGRILRPEDEGGAKTGRCVGGEGLVKVDEQALVVWAIVGRGGDMPEDVGEHSVTK